MSGVIDRFPLLLPVRNSFASYGASAVTRTRDTQKPNVKRVYPRPSDVHESAEKRKKRRSATLAAASKDVAASAADGLQP